MTLRAPKYPSTANVGAIVRIYDKKTNKHSTAERDEESKTSEVLDLFPFQIQLGVS